MAYRSLLVHLDRSPRRAARLAIAFSLAARFQAHLTGLFALSAVPVPSSVRAESPEFFAGLMRQQRAAAAQAAREQFEALASRQPEVVTEWREGEEDGVQAMLTAARYAELLVLGQHQDDASVDGGVDAAFLQELLLKAAKPALVVPYAGSFEVVGRRVLVAWNGGAQATRAIDSALPLIEQASEVHVAVFGDVRGDAREGDHGEEPGADIGLYLARHNAHVSVTRSRAELDVGAQILNRASDLGADLIVMGAYGKSPLRERLLGGATRTLLESMTVPVLMAH